MSIPKRQIRKLKAGDWYWMDKVVVQEYVPKIGAMGVSVYSFLASMADNSQRCFPSQKYVAERLGCSRSTVNKTVKNLEKHGLIRKEKRGGYRCRYILLDVRCKAGETGVLRRGNLDVAQVNTNDNKITRNINNIDKGKILNVESATCKGFKPRTKEELLALDLAEALNDCKGLPLYLSYVKKYPDYLLRESLGKALEIPEGKIKKSRAALFNHLVRKEARQRRVS